MSVIKPYKISVDESKLERLKKKLALADFPDEIGGVGWSRGPPLADLQRLTKYWQEGFDWRKAEAKLNELSHFSVDIPVEEFETLNIHFLHQESKAKGAIPLLFAHGWPGSFFEVTKIIRKLAASGNGFPAFHVVAPSLPNFGFSEGTKKVWQIVLTWHLVRLHRVTVFTAVMLSR
jgi:pimeloyl-ACP methyl ester carboxylesterase